VRGKGVPRGFRKGSPRSPRPRRVTSEARVPRSCSKAGSRVALTLFKFIQAARAAEGAHGGRLPAAASLHPRGGAASERPGATWRRVPGLRGRARSSAGRPAEAAEAAGARGSPRRVTTMHQCRPVPSPLTPSAPREPSRTRGQAARPHRAASPGAHPGAPGAGRDGGRASSQPRGRPGSRRPRVVALFPGKDALDSPRARGIRGWPRA
jgi:hypothetical protein